MDKALIRCGYPKWSIRRVRDHGQEKQEGGAKKEDSDRVTNTIVMIPYIKGVSEALSWVFSCHGVVMAMKPHLTLNRMLVHTKDKRTPQENVGVARTPQENVGVAYQVTCKDYPCVYTGETEKVQSKRKGTLTGC